jgi:hypothetical protein
MPAIGLQCPRTRRAMLGGITLAGHPAVVGCREDGGRLGNEHDGADDYEDHEHAGERQRCHDRAEIFARLVRHACAHTGFDLNTP